MPPATSSFVCGVVSPIPTSPVLSAFSTFVPPAISDTVFAVARPNPVSVSPVNTHTGFVDDATSPTACGFPVVIVPIVRPLVAWNLAHVEPPNDSLISSSLSSNHPESPSPKASPVDRLPTPPFMLSILNGLVVPTPTLPVVMSV